MKITGFSINPSITHSLEGAAHWLGRKVTQLTSYSTSSKKVAVLVLGTLGALCFLITKGLSVIYRNYFNSRELTEESICDLTKEVSLAEEEKNNLAKELIPLDLQKFKANTEGLIETYNNLIITGEQKSLEALAALKKQVESFLTTYCSYIDSDPFDTSLTKDLRTIERMNQIIEGLSKYFAQLVAFYTQLAGPNDVISISPDGNCWLHSAIVGLDLADRVDPQEITYHALRESIVDWMQIQVDNETATPEFKKYLLEAAEPALEGEVSEENIEELWKGNQQSIINYLTLMTQDRTFGGRPEFYAIAHLYQVNVIFLREVSKNALSESFDPSILLSNEYPSIYIVMNRRGNHFNVRLPPLSPPSS